MVFGFLHSSKSSKGSKPPSSSRMPTGYYEQPSVQRPSTSSSLHRRNAIKSSHSSSGQYANRIEVTPWTRPGTGHRQAPPMDMSYGMPPSSSSSSSRPPTLRRQDAFYHESGYPVDLGSMSGGPQMNFTPAQYIPAPPHAYGQIPGYAHGPLPLAPHQSSRSSRPSTSSRAQPPPPVSVSRSRSHNHGSRHDPRRDSNGISPIDAMFPPEVQRVLGPDHSPHSFSSRSGSRSGSSRSHGNSHGNSHGSSHGHSSHSAPRGLPPQPTAVSSRARSARQYAMDNDTSCFRSDYAGGFHRHGGYPPGYNPFVAAHNQPNYNPHPTGYPGGNFF